MIGFNVLHIPGGIASIKSLIEAGDPSVRMSVEYEKPEVYRVSSSLADSKDLKNPPSELLHQFIAPRSVTPPGRSLTYLRNCIVLPNAAIITAGGSIIRESCFPYADRRRILKMFEPWLFEQDGEIYARTEAMETVDTPAVYLREHGEMGFFHWMHSVFPRIDVIADQFIPSEFALLIQDKAHYQIESLKLYDTGGRAILRPSSHSPQYFNELIFPSALVENGDFWLRPPSVKRFYERLPVQPGEMHKRIYVTRQDAQMRRLANEENLMNLVKNQGFVAVELAKLKFSEQLALFRDAEMVVGVHGAGLAHIVSMKTATGVLEILHPRRFWATYRALAARSNLHYGFVIGDDPDTSVAGDSFDFNIDLEKLESVLSSLINTIA